MEPGTAERVAALETRLARAEDDARQYRAIVESATDFAIVVTDRDGTVTGWNAGARRIFGWSVDEMLGQPAARFFTSGDRVAGRPQTEMQLALDSGRASDDRWHLKKDGSLFWATGEMMPLRSDAGVHIGYLKIVRDSTDERRAVDRQRADAEFLRSVLAASGDCTMVLDLDGKLTFVHDAGLRLLDPSAADTLLGMSWLGLWRSEHQAQAQTAMAGALGGKAGHFRGVASGTSGVDRQWDVQVTPIVGFDGRPERLLAVARDITESGVAEQALREAQGLNASILGASNDCIVVLDRDARNLYVSPGGIAGMEIDDVGAVLGLSWLRVWQGADRVAAERAVADALGGGVGRFEGFCQTHRGTPKWWDVVISPLPVAESASQRLVSIGRDITAQRDAQQQLAHNEKRYRLLTESLPQLVWTTLPTGRCDYLSRQWLDYTGTAVDRQLGTGWLDAVHPDDRETTRQRWQAAVAAQHDYDVDYRLRRHDGVYRWFKVRGTPIRDVDGAVASWFGTCTDIEDVVAARDVLARSRRDLEQIVAERTRERDSAWKNSRDLQAVLGTDGRFRAVNDAWTTILGWATDALVDRHYLDFVHPDDHPSSREALTIASADDLPVYENRYRHEDGGFRWISWVAAPQDGLVYASGRHITAEKEAARALEAAQEQLRQSQKMEAVGQLTGGLAHDFNNRLTGVTGSLELLKKRIAQGRAADVDRYVGTALDAARRAASLTHRLLAFSRRQTLDPKPIDVNRLVLGMEELVRRTVGPEVDLEVVGAAGLWTTLVDPNQLENALLNLCINARDAMPDGGRLTIETANKWMDDRAGVERSLPAGQYVSLCVTDTGTGMSSEVVQRAFDPFFTTKPIGLGTGLGLSMVYGFARQSGGQVRIYSEVGHGTTMCVYLPRHRGPADADAEPPLATGLSTAGSDPGETVLVVDDDATVRMLVGEVLRELGYGVLEAAHGGGGLQVLESAARIDLLITDVGLPGGMNGRQMADAGRALRPGLKVLFITGYAENAVLGNGYLDHGMQVMTKPFTMQDLAVRTQALIAQE